MPSSRSSNLKVIKTDGTIADIFSDSYASFDDIKLLSNGKLYTSSLYTAAVLDSTGSNTAAGYSCKLSEISTQTGVTTCIDSSSSTNYIKYSNPAWVQLDAQGAIYYQVSSYSSSTSSYVLRKYHQGASTDLFVTSESVVFLVLPDGNIYMSGSTQATGLSWLRRLSPAGALSNLLSGYGGSIQQFPDGNAYVSYSGITKIVTSSHTVSSNQWLGTSDTADYSASSVGTYSFGRTFKTSDSKIYGISNKYSGSGSGLFRFYPTPTQITLTTVATIISAAAAGANVVVYGLNSSSQNKLVLYNTTSGAETDLLSSMGVEIYNLSYSSTTNKVYFSGLRFTDSKYVIGYVDTTSLSSGIIDVGTTKLLDLEAL